MPARIIETNESPLNPIEVDGITVDLIENALKNAREEMDALVSRTALSPGIREQGDCFPMIANREGKMVVGQFGSFIHGFTDLMMRRLKRVILFLPMILICVMQRFHIFQIGWF